MLLDILSYEHLYIKKCKCNHTLVITNSFKNEYLILIIMDSDNNMEINYTIDNWNDYRDKVDSQLTTMWNFVLYNQFTNEEIRRLHRKINYLNEDLDKSNKEYQHLSNKFEDIYRTNKTLKRKISKLEDEINPPIKKRKVTNLLETEFHDINIDYLFLSLQEKEDYLKHTYQNLNSISDIIKLKDNINKFNYVNDQKFIKLYNLIPSLEELDNIIGMTEVKDTIFKAICYFIHGLNNKSELNHVMITGPPGVGKTTVAKIIGKIYLQLDFLENDTFITARRSDLIAKYLGQTAIKTQDVIDKALGGVLFIDEVYSLGNSEKKDSFAKECIDTLNLNMTREDKPWLLIVGGYKEDIENSFLAFNKGLERRFTVKLNIEKYSAEELYLILLKFIKDDKWDIEDDAVTVDDIKEYYEYFKFYAGDMQKLFQLSKQFYSIRLMKEALVLGNNNNKLSRKDIQAGIDSIKDLVNSRDNSKEIMDEYIKHSMYV